MPSEQSTVASQQNLPAWADDLDSAEWQAILADLRWLDLVRRMAAEVAAEDTAEWEPKVCNEG